MTGTILLIIVCMSIGAWFLIGENTSIYEKLMIILLVVFVYVFVMICTGASSVGEITAPVKKIFDL